MKSIREATFETNSSSCHCIVFCNTDLKKKLERKEVIYVGDFEYGDDYYTYENDIDPDKVLTREEVIELLKKFRDDSDSDFPQYIKDYQIWLKEHPEFEQFTIRELEGLTRDDDCDIDWVLDHYNLAYTKSEIIFGSRDADVQTISSRELGDTTVLHTSIYC